MKKLPLALLAVVVLVVSCSKIFDTSVLERNIVELKDRVTALEEQCKQMNTNISSLQTIVTALQDNDYVTGVAPITQNGVEIGYTISFSKSGSITIYHGKDGSNGLDGSDGSDGSDGASGSTPVVGVKQDTDGVYYWTLNGEWLLNDSGEKVKAISTDGKDGEDGQDGTNGKDGKDGITPQLKIENGYWYVSYNNGESWESLGKATGDNGQDGANGADGAAGSDGDSFFQSVTQDENNVIFTLADGTVITVPKSSSYLFNKLQSVSYVPKFNDGKATVYYSAASNSQVEMDFEVSPKDAVEDIAAQWETILSLKAVNTQTRAVTYIDMPILGCTADAQHGVITVTASGKNLAANFFSGEQTVSARLGISDGNTNITSEYIELFAAPAVEPFSNEIWYTSTDGNIVEPYKTDGFGANILSNTYSDGKGVIVFDNNVTKIGTEAFYGSKTLKSMVVPYGVTIFEAGAFNGCKYLESINTPNSVTTIESWAFNVCSQLKDVVIPDSVTTIQSGAFQLCGMQTLKIGSGLKVIERECFNQCVNLQTLTIPGTVEQIKGDAFKGCDSLTELNIEEGVKIIEGNAFMCDSLERVTLPNSITTITGNPFECCWALKGFYGSYHNDDNSMLLHNNTIYSYAFAYGKVDYIIPSGVTAIAERAFVWNNIKSVEISDSVQSIGTNAFAAGTLETVVIGSGIQKIDPQAFEGNGNLKIVICNAVLPPKGGELMFNSNHADRKIYVPDASVESYKAAEYWSDYADAIYPISGFTTTITYTTTDGNVAVSAFETIDGLIPYFVSNTNENGEGKLVVKGLLKALPDHAFEGSTNLKTVVIPDTVLSIGVMAFNDCSALTDITIPSSVSEIKTSAFRQCSAMQKIVVPDSVTSLGDEIFGGCSSLKDVTLPSNITDITSSMFCDCTSLTELDIPANVTTIGFHAFLSCTNLTTVTLKERVSYLANEAFLFCTKLSTVNVKAKTPPTLETRVFDGNAADFKIYVPRESLDAYKTAWLKESYDITDKIEPYDW